MARSSQRGWPAILAVLVAADVVSSFGTVMVYAALKRFYVEFGDPVAVGWTISAYMLTSGAAAVACGRLGDLFGSKRILLILLASAAVGATLSATHGTLGWVVAGRTIEGLAGAIFPLCFALMRHHVPEPRIPLATGILLSAGAIGTILGLVIGGLIIDHAPWQAMFWSTASVAALTLVLAWLVIPPDVRIERPSGSLDLVAGFAFVPAVVALLLAISKLGAWGPGDPRVLGLLVAGAGIATWWARHELSLSAPLIDLRLLGAGRIARPNLCMITVALGPLQLTMVMMLLIQQPTWTGIGLGLSAAMAGALKTPANIGSIILSPAIGQLCRGVGSGRIAVAAALLNILAWILALVWTGNRIAVGVMIFLSTVGTTATFIAVTSALTFSAPKEKVGEVMGVTALARAMATALGAQFVTLLLATTTVIDPARPSARLPAPQSYQLVFATIIGISLLGLAAAMAMFRREQPVRPEQLMPAAE